MKRHPCKGCVEKRKALTTDTVNCHSVCEEYLEVKMKNDKDREETQRRKKAESYVPKG